eukprot:SAG31_NODE_26758_length_437_cov_0.612426_1_plen_50_part_00
MPKLRGHSLAAAERREAEHERGHRLEAVIRSFRTVPTVVWGRLGASAKS